MATSTEASSLNSQNPYPFVCPMSLRTSLFREAGMIRVRAEHKLSTQDGRQCEERQQTRLGKGQSPEAQNWACRLEDFLKLLLSGCVWDVAHENRPALLPHLGRLRSSKHCSHVLQTPPRMANSSTFTFTCSPQGTCLPLPSPTRRDLPTQALADKIPAAALHR